MKDYLMTTGPYLDGYRIDEYKGIVTGVATFGVGLLTDFLTEVANIVASEDERVEDKLEAAKEVAMEKLLAEAEKTGGNALIAVKIGYSSIHSLLVVTASATSVLVSAVEK